ncbi:MAG: TonB C-terminal domain-containing protein [Kiritimatiellae bacterium]|nr:TonB C-terminal domain-containing protein [Kiritimatiellia bacterium]
MHRPARRRYKASLAASLVLHGLLAALLLGTTLMGKGCTSKKPNPKLMFVEFTVAVPPAEPEPPAPQPPEPAPPAPAPEPPPPPPPDNIPEPTPKPEQPKKEAPKPPEPPKPKPPKVIKQNNRVVRTQTPPNAPAPKGPVLTQKQIEDLLKKGAKIGSSTVIPDDPSAQKLGAYSNHVRDRLYAAWQQPESLKNLPGLMATVQITIQQDGRVGNGKILKSSGNATMDGSVLKAVRTVKAMRALPAGIKGPIDLEIEFELAQ